jgi:HAD superfamily hydrolase (TIGR01509 family)
MSFNIDASRTTEQRRTGCVEGSKLPFRFSVAVFFYFFTDLKARHTTCLMKSVLFDLDGTIADTETLKAKALASAIEQFGGRPKSEIYKQVMGQSWESVTSAFFAESGIRVSLDQFNPAFREIYGRLIDEELAETRRIAPFLQLLKSKGILIGLVSSASPWMIHKTLLKLHIEDAFEVVISNADTVRHKPHPDAYLIALAKLRVEPSNAIAFEDSESGFQSARAAGLTVYGVKHLYNAGHSFDLCARTLTSFDECLNWEIFVA